MYLSCKVNSNDFQVVVTGIISKQSPLEPLTSPLRACFHCKNGSIMTHLIGLMWHKHNLLNMK